MRLRFRTLLFLGVLTSAAAGRERAQVVSPQTPNGPAAYGIAKLVKAISDRGLAVASANTTVTGAVPSPKSNVTAPDGVRALPDVAVTVAVKVTSCPVIEGPGEELTVALIKEGNQPGQGVGYLDDGTMVVVENGRDCIGQTLAVVVTTYLQTSAGKMIFAGLKTPNGAEDESAEKGLRAHPGGRERKKTRSYG